MADEKEIRSTEHGTEKEKLKIARLNKPDAQHRKRLREALQGVSDDAMASLLLNIKQGDSQALNIWASRVLPQPKSVMEPVKFKISKGGTLVEKCDEVLAAIADGKLPPDIGLNLITALGTMARVVEVDELAKKLESLEAMLAGNGGES